MVAPSIAVIGNGDERVVVLGAPLVHQKVVVTAAAVIAWIIAAGGGTRLINRAAALFGIEELADPPEVLVAFPAHQILVAVAFARKALLRGGERDPEIFRKAFDIALRQRDDRIRAAVSGTVQTFIVSHLRLWRSGPECERDRMSGYRISRWALSVKQAFALYDLPFAAAAIATLNSRA